jgi:Uma2 family endonuclease
MIDAKRMTIGEFDRWVETADECFTYELHDGVVYSFASRSAAHGRLCTRLGGWLIAAVKAPCEVFLGTLSVRRHPERPSSVIPDALVTCESVPARQIYATAPKFVIEVISPTSVVNDLIRKPRIYNAIASIEEYLLVDSRAMWARVFRRDETGELPLEGEGVTAPDSTVDLQSVGIAFTLADIYRGVLEPASFG